MSFYHICLKFCQSRKVRTGHRPIQKLCHKPVFRLTLGFLREFGTMLLPYPGKPVLPIHKWLEISRKNDWSLLAYTDTLVNRVCDIMHNIDTELDWKKAKHHAFGFRSLANDCFDSIISMDANWNQSSNSISEDPISASTQKRIWELLVKIAGLAGACFLL